VTTTATPTDLDLAPRLRLAVSRLARRLRQQSADGLTPSQTSALATIERNGPITPSELARIEQIQRPTATRVLTALEGKLLLTRERDQSDGRLTRVTVSREGAAVLKRGRSRKNAYLERRLGQLEPDELDTLERAAALIERLLADQV
jgi:DNA-binding MarR family transcriptional regulator